MSIPLSDLHCHILPGIDDGAKNFSVTQDLLEKEWMDGVREIIFTPHLYLDSMNLNSFLENRTKAFEKVQNVCRTNEISIKMGAEVRLCPELMITDMTKLTMGDTGYFLLEWPFSTYPIWGNDVVAKILSLGLAPIFAHIERYDYFFKDPDNLARYLGKGIVTQMNADTIIDKATQKQALKLIKEGYIHIIASDAHNMEKRPPHLNEAYDIIEKYLGKEVKKRLMNNGHAIFNGLVIDTEPKRR